MSDDVQAITLGRQNASIEALPDAISRIAQLARSEADRDDETQRELLEALDTAWLAAERWRIERSAALMDRLQNH